MLRIYEVGGKLWEAVQDFCVDSFSRVRVEIDVTSGFRLMLVFMVCLILISMVWCDR